jgi:hypothetical protein
MIVKCFLFFRHQAILPLKNSSQRKKFSLLFSLSVKKILLFSSPLSLLFSEKRYSSLLTEKYSSHESTRHQSLWRKIQFFRIFALIDSMTVIPSWRPGHQCFPQQRP